MKRVFYITNKDITVYHWNNNEVVEARVFGSDEECQVRFFQYMDDHRDLVSLALVDVIEEEFKNEKLPHVSGKEKRGLLDRKLGQLFRHLKFRAYAVQSREESGRKDDKVLFSAFSNPSLLELLLSWIEVYKVPLEGIYSAPHALSCLLKNLKTETQYNLLVSEHMDNHQRQSFFENSELKNSRMSALTLTDTHESDVQLALEVQKNKRFLNRLQLLPHEEYLDIYLLKPSSSRFKGNLDTNDADKWRYHTIDFHDLCKTVKLKNHSDAVTIEMLLVHVLCTRCTCANYAPLQDRKYYVHQQAAKYTLAASLAIAVAGLGLSLNNALDTVSYKQRTLAATQTQQQLKSQHRALTATKPSFPISAQEMKQAVFVGTHLAREKLNPVKLFKTLSYHVSNHPQILVQSLTWTVNTPKSVQKRSTNRLSVRHHAAPKREFGKVYRRVKVIGSVKDFNGNFRQAFNIVNAFIDSVKKEPGFTRVHVVKLPIDVNSDNRVTGVSGALNNQPNAKFHVEFYVRSSDENK